MSQFETEDFESIFVETVIAPKFYWLNGCISGNYVSSERNYVK